ncbi:MAG TPA: DUF1493 family protein [Terriglobales bacterium]
MGSLSFEEFVDFIRSQCGISQKKTITLESRFEDDLGVMGDDGDDLLKATEKHFNVQLSDAEHGYRKTFDLGPNEFLFQGEGLFNYEGSVREFTVGDLYRAVQNASTDISE